MLALSDDPRSTQVWQQGAQGERKLGRRLDGLATAGLGVLHDRRIPGSRANIDHIVVGPGGVFVIDAKRHSGRIERRSVGSLFRPATKLFVGGRDKTSLVQGMAKQVAAVHRALQDLPEPATVPVQPVICFVEGDWSLFAKPFTVDSVVVTWPVRLEADLRQGAALSATQIAGVADRLARKLPVA